MTAPCITCVLPTHNGRRYLRDSIDSVLRQEDGDFELIVVDDCSTDETPAILDEYARADARVRVVRNQINLKLPASLNVGFRAARGRFFTWTSDDNLYEPQAFRVMVELLERRTDVGLVYSSFRLIDEAGALCGDCRVPEVDRLPTVNIVKASFLYRREVHEQLGGYREDRFLTEDYDFWLRASMRFRFATAPEFLYRYRNHSGSLSETRQREIQRATWQLINEHLPALTWAPQPALASAYLYQADRSLRFGRRGQALREALTGFGKSPYAAWRAFKEIAHGRYRGWKGRFRAWKQSRRVLGQTA